MNQSNTLTINGFERGLLRYINMYQLEKIQSKRIGIGGVGGLGSNVAMILTRSGFKNFEILDCDLIDASNLNRQQYYFDEIGKNKVEVTKERLISINPDLNVQTYNTIWNLEYAHKFFLECDFIIEAFDRADFKFQFVDYYQDKTRTIISGNGMAGLTEKKPMNVRKLGNIYMVGDGTTDSTCGNPPMAPRVTACAAMMSEIVLDLTLGLKINTV